VSSRCSWWVPVSFFVSMAPVPGDDLNLRAIALCCLAEHCAGLVNQLNKVRDGAPMGDAPEFVQAANMRDAFQQAGKRVQNARGERPNACVPPPKRYMPLHDE
jgi:hypothetical protein